MKNSLLLVLLLSPFLVLAQLDLARLDSIKKAKGDIKVGVVLSGGGAKGVAHVGVLRMIENAGVQIDYIGGTSMGAIVSGLYAIGYTVDQLDSIISGMDMSKMVSGELERKYKTFVAKRYDNATLLQLPIKGMVVGLPGGMSNGQDVMDQFNYLTRGHHGYQDFNNFTVPLVVMGTDIVTGESVEFHSGSLPLALRASSSFPSLFAPVEVEDRLLVDGGVANNFPVQEVINMGADVIIGVSVEDGLYSRKDLESINNIIEQITSFKMVEKSNAQKKLVDVYLVPDIKGFSVVSFDKADEILERGEVEGFKNFNNFLAIAKLQDREPVERQRLLLPDSYNIVEFESNSSENYDHKYFVKKFDFGNLPKQISYNYIDETIKVLKGTQNFDMISYELIKVDGGYKFKLFIKEKSVNKYLKLGIHYDDLYRFGALVNLNFHNVIFKSSNLLVGTVLSEKPRFKLTYYKDNAAWPGFLFQSVFNQFEVQMPTAAIITATSLKPQGSFLDLNTEDWTTSFMVQKTINEDFFVGAGVEYKFLNVYTRSLAVKNQDGTIQDSPFLIDRSKFFNPKAEIYADTRDDSDFPKKGLLFSAEYKIIRPMSNESEVDSVRYKTTTMLKSKIEYTLPLNSAVSWTNSFESNIRIGTEVSNGLAFTFGGYNRNNINNNTTFYGYELFGIASQHDKGFYKLYTRMQVELAENWFFNMHFNYLEVVRADEKWLKLDKIDHTGYAVSLANKSVLGPIELTASYSPENKLFYLAFNFGYWF